MINSQNQADQLGMLLAQIAELTKQADSIKDSMKDAATSGGPTVFEGSFFKSTYSQCNRETIDHKAVYAHIDIDPTILKHFTKVTAVFSVKTTSR